MYRIGSTLDCVSYILVLFLGGHVMPVRGKMGVSYLDVQICMSRVCDAG